MASDSNRTDDADSTDDSVDVPDSAEDPVDVADADDASTAGRGDGSTDHQRDETLQRIVDRTPTRLGVGRAGPRPTTESLLEFRADHGLARDAVHSRVDERVVDDLGLVKLRTQVADTDQYLARPDLGRELAHESLEVLRTECEHAPDVQLIVSDGLSSTAVEANVPELLAVLRDGLADRDIDVGTPVFVEYGRVDVMDAIGEELEVDCCVNLVGERPGLRTAESLSAYLVYGPERGLPTAKKSVISNIHDGGLPPVEAGAELVDLIAEMLEREASGIDLRDDDREFTT